jgi:recombination protein RecR
MLDEVIQQVIDALSKLPGIGPKGAQRIAFWLMSQPTNEVLAIAQTLENIKLKAKYCSICGNITQNEVCDICLDQKRDSEIVCVVEEPKDLLAIEKTHEFTGKYHVLGGVINPIQSIGPDQLRIALLKKRVDETGIKELVLAMNPSVQGRATASYIIDIFSSYDIKITRIAQGIPMGSEIEYADELTLSEALTYRQILKQ